MDSIEIMTNRANPGIDPIFHIWEWQIPVYLFLGGLVAGIMIIASAQEWKFTEKWEPRLSRIVPILAMVLLSLGMLVLYLDLEIKGLKLNVIRLYMTFRPASPISLGCMDPGYNLPFPCPYGSLPASLSRRDESFYGKVSFSCGFGPSARLGSRNQKEDPGGQYHRGYSARHLHRNLPERHGSPSRMALRHPGTVVPYLRHIRRRCTPHLLQG